MLKWIERMRDDILFLFATKRVVVGVIVEEIAC